MATVASGPLIALGRVLDVVAGLPPRPRLAVGGRRGHFGGVTLAVRGALWGGAFGVLAPATSGLVLLSGLAAEDVTVVGSTDLGFFFGFVPLLTAIVVVLLSLNHWPLRNLRTYHRELAVALLLVGVVTLVGLRDHGAEVTDDQWVDAWLFVNGSLVLHVLAIWGLVRLAIRDITALHAGRSGWYRFDGPSDGVDEADEADEQPLPWDRPRYGATASLALRSVLWGVAIGTISGAAAGTLVVPLLGTLVGAYYGAIYGLPPTVLGTVAVVTAVSWRRDTDPLAVRRTVNVTLAAVGVVAAVGSWPFLQSARIRPEPWEDANVVLVWLIVLPVVALLLRYCAPRLADAYIALSREQDD